MNKTEDNVSSAIKLNTLAKSIYNESIEMGFKSEDFVKLMNEILDMTISNKIELSQTSEIQKEKKRKIAELPIHSKNLTIRQFNSKIDMELVSNWFRDESNRLFLLSTTTKHELDVSKIISDEKNIFATITLKDQTPIGLLALLNVDRQNSKGEMRKMIGDISQRGKGFGKEATKVWLKYCSEFIGLNKIYINTIETNIKNITLNRQLGFKIEGLLKSECVIDNTKYDVLRMAYFKQ